MNRFVLAWLLTATSLARTATVEEFLTKRGYTAIPMKVNVIHHYVIDGKVNGRKALMMIDTGASYLAVDKSLASGLKPIAELPKKMYGLFGEFTTPGIAV